ncbi:DUF2085 domain-containing protein [bacterium]|nr:DUF2085 domain-containing protein [bacterium]MCB2179032.1 DUF2085 domain-containing protein [bacterium]
MEIEVTLYTRKNCHLCETAEADLHALQDEVPYKLLVVDIDEDPDLQLLYGHKVPVVSAGPFTLAAPFDRRKLRMTLGAARDSQAQRLEYEGDDYKKKLTRKREMSSGDRVSHFIASHYLKVINIVLLLYFGLPFLAPVLMKVGLPRLAQPIYSVYKLSCHELAFRSWFLFGEQPVYPRAAAGMDDYASYEEVTGNNPNDLLTARNFVGNEQLGYKVAFCERDIAIYGAMLLFGIIFSLSGRKIKPLPFLLWVLVGIMPIALDGVSQLISQMFEYIPYRESTPLLRTITGALFGFTTGWFGFPVLEESMQETRQHLSAKKARAAHRENNE